MEEMTIETKRLKITPASDAQMEDLVEKQTIPELKKAYQEMLDGALTHPDERVWYAVWNIELNDAPGVTIGDLSFKGIDQTGIVEIGYGMHSEFEGKGYMTEAVTAVAQWAYSQPCVKAVEAETDPDNIASQRVLEKAGFVPTGEQGEEGPRFLWQGNGK